MYSNIEIFIKLVTSVFANIKHKAINDNLTRDQRKALGELKVMKDVIIKPSDKGGNVVLWSSKAYEREAFRQLRNSDCHKKLTFKPLSKFQQELIAIVQRAVEQDIITEKQGKCLLIGHPRIATMYFLPKIHKHPTIPSGRSIVSGNGNPSENICRFIDHFLQPIVETLPSFVKDTNDLLFKIDGQHLESVMIIATCDVESLYTSKRHTTEFMQYDPSYICLTYMKISVISS